MSKQPLRTVPHGVMHVPVTPFKDDMSVDYATFEKLVDWHVRQKPSSLCVILHIAESVSLTVEEHKKLIEISVKVTNGRVPVIANVSNAGTEIAIDLARHAEKVGADTLLARIIAMVAEVENVVQFPAVAHHEPVKFTQYCPAPATPPHENWLVFVGSVSARVTERATEGPPLVTV